MTHPHITIITVVKNGEKTIERCIKSVIEQNFPDKQYIIIDGVSDDGTVGIIEKYRDCIDVFVSEPDDGIYHAMNKALTMSEGEIIYFLNSDDWLEPGALDRVERLFKHEDTDIIAGHVYHWEHGRRAGVNKNMPEAIDYGTPFCHQGLFARKRVFEQVGPFNTEYRICADYEWILRAYHHGYSFTCVNDVFANYTKGGLSSDNLDTLVELIDISEKNISRASDPAQVRRINTLRKADLVFDHSYANNIGKAVAGLKECIGSPTHEITVWGAGKLGAKCVNLLLDSGISVGQVADSDPVKWGSRIGGIDVVSPDMVKHSDKVLIAAPGFRDEILHKCLDLGIAEEDILFVDDLIDHLYEEYTVGCGNGIR